MLSLADVTVDPELEACCPALSSDERLQLLANITRDGFREPIIVWLGHAIVIDVADAARDPSELITGGIAIELADHLHLLDERIREVTRDARCRNRGRALRGRASHPRDCAKRDYP